MSPIFNVQDLIPYRGPLIPESTQQREIGKDVQDIQVKPKSKLQAEKVLDSRIQKTTRCRVYREYLIKWSGLPEAEATWMDEEECRKQGISLALLPTSSS